MKPAPVKPNVTFDELQKLDIRVGTIESVTDVEGSKKLVKLIVNFGDHSRTILAGIKQEREDPSEIAGKQALFVVNRTSTTDGRRGVAGNVVRPWIRRWRHTGVGGSGILCTKRDPRWLILC